MVGFVALQNQVLGGGESLGQVRLPASVCSVKLICKIIVRVVRWCFSNVVLQAVAFWQCRFARKVGKAFHFMGLVLGKSFRCLVVVLCSQVFVMALFFYVRCLSCLNNERRFIMASVLTAAEAQVSKSMPNTACSGLVGTARLF